MTSPQPSGQQTLLPAQTCVDALVAAEGNSRLAAERLHITQQVLVASIASDPTAERSLNAQLKTLTTLMTFDTLRASKALMDEAIADMDPADRGKFFTDLTKRVVELTDDHTSTQNVNVTEVVLRMLPPEARQAFLTLVGSNADAALGDGADPHTRTIEVDMDDDAA